MCEPDSDTDLTVPDSWREAAECAGDSPGLVMVLGDCDTGKSTLCAFLAKHFCGAGKSVGFVDSDVGQSTLGPPMTIGGKVCSGPVEAQPDLHPPFLFFTGSATPVGRMVESIEGTVRVAQRVKAAGMDWIIVDTTGMISGETGRQLKLQKAWLLRPRWVIALQHGDELEGMLAHLEREGPAVIRAQAPPEAKRRSREHRRKRRFEAYAEYFNNVQPIRVDVSSIPIYDFREEIPAGTLVGLNNEQGDTLAVGCVTAFDRDRGMVELRAPRVDMHAVKYLKLASPDTDLVSDCVDE